MNDDESKGAGIEVEVTVNGRSRRLRGDAGRTLLDALRNDLDLKGTRFGCGLEQCGSCMVLIDDQPVRACGRSLVGLDGARIVTLEGLAECVPARQRVSYQGRELHPLQQAFLDEQAGQCGFCLSGILVSAAALLMRNPEPERDDIVQALDAHLCRCGAHTRIIRAVARAAGSLRGEGAA
ncbi:MAG: (2Fe-2S)-binding protein [Gammaproteobacteria bacterium]|nr:(2Fe-2S)-binding protein [Gammaproteobacteria bacterium]